MKSGPDREEEQYNIRRRHWISHEEKQAYQLHEEICSWTTMQTDDGRHILWGLMHVELVARIQRKRYRLLEGTQVVVDLSMITNQKPITTPTIGAQ